ncbi:MAG: twin-arginine translocation signal domain-containing protein [Chloroflexi bacterium]|nr:twin-arginine translocation signal domain-containing protein [Chloroflexota bacterium]
MSEKHIEQQVDRRKFLKAAAITAVAAGATGAGAALLKPRSSAPVTATPTALPAVQPVDIVQDQATDLLAQLAAAQAENVRLQANLAAAQRRLDAQANAPDTVVQTMSVELESANERIGALAGLVALYEQLDDIDMSDWIEEGMTAVSDAITDLTDDLPSLSDGIAWGRQALTELDDHIPLLEDGRSWLTEQTDKLQRYFEAVEALLEAAVERVGPILQMFAEWVQDILKWLPFGLGQHTSVIMDALTNLLMETPQTVGGMQTNVVAPLDAWLGGDGEVPLRQNVINPLREDVLTKADQVTAKSTQVKTVYQENIARPVGTAVANRRQVRALIAAYRQKKQL